MTSVLRRIIIATGVAALAGCAGQVLDLGDAGTLATDRPAHPCQVIGGGADSTFTQCTEGYVCDGDPRVNNAQLAAHQVTCDCTTGECTCLHNGVAYATVNVGACKCAQDYPLAIPESAAKGCGDL